MSVIKDFYDFYSFRSKGASPLQELGGFSGVLCKAGRYGLKKKSSILYHIEFLTLINIFSACLIKNKLQVKKNIFKNVLLFHSPFPRADLTSKYS